MLMTEIEMGVHQALEEFHELLRICSLEQSPPRYLAARYQVCRTALMTSKLRSYLPGFVRQCVSSLTFRQFICLYDHEPTVRMKFIDRSLESCWTQLNERPAHDVFDADDF
jgi:hypothetical protein